jgi:site-specific DNA-methyltransferase (adenine-specific)
MNQLYFGDNLDILKQLYVAHPQGFIDLIYIDPPFNSKRNYNILFEDADLDDAKAQKEAFADTWSHISYLDTLNEIQDIDLNLYYILSILDKSSLPKGAVSYLCTMAIRIWYMHKVLKNMGSFYLHCDPTMSHYLKIVCDMIFGNKNFRNEITWCYRKWAVTQHQFVSNHDVILFYSKTSKNTFNTMYVPLSKGTLKRWKGKKQKAIFDETGKRLATNEDNESKGSPMADWWEISVINPAAKERLGYPTQKPEALLERIIKASSNEGDLVADFCCGCGTTIAVAQKLNRRWLGVDISHLSIKLVMKRLQETYDTKYAEIRQTFEVFGIPKDIASARALAESDDQGRFKFQDWVIEFLLSGVSNPKKTADGGWDGHITFAMGKKKEVVLIEVKSGKVNVKNLREFIHVVNTQKAAIGVFVCFQEQVTTPMIQEAKQQGFYTPNIDQIGEYKTQFPKIQLLTVEQLLNGEQVKIPMTTQGVFKTAGKYVQESTQESFL